MLKVDEVLALVKDTRSSFYRRHPLRLKKVKVGRSSFWSLRTVMNWIQDQSNSTAA
jgi:predicted DNA-binding transcriptional regulator AlpA